MAQEAVIFDLPIAQTPEPGDPALISHGCDYDFDGVEMSYFYNFISYEWSVDGQPVTARAYLDDVDCVSIFAPFARVAQEPAFRPLLQYLQRRYLYICTFERAGAAYVLRYRRRGAPERAA